MWACGWALARAPVTPAGRGFDRGCCLGGGRLHLGGGLHSSGGRSGCCGGDGSSSLPRLRVAGPIVSITSASFSNSAARGDLLTAGRRGDSGGAGGGGGDHRATDAGANAIVKVRCAVAISVGSAAIG